MDLGRGKIASIALHRFAQILNEVVTDALFKIAWSDIFVKINDFLM